VFVLVITAIVVVPLAELWVILRVGEQVGLVPTIASLVIISALGTALVRREGTRVWRDFTTAVSRGEEPSRQIVHGVCLLVAGVFLLSPGFVTDIIGIVLLLPPTRAAVASVVSRRVHGGVTVVTSMRSGPIVDRGYIGRNDDVVDVVPVEGEDHRERDDETGTTGG